MKVVLSLSGGLDSAVLLTKLVEAGHEILAVTFNYGSKHGAYEIQAAKNLASHFGIKHQIIYVAGIFEGFNSALLKSDNRQIPEGHYEAPTMSQTVVPCRNMIFASILAGLAESLGYQAVYLGIHAGDHAIYPDCRPSFKQAMGVAIYEATETKVSLQAPFISMTKGDIVFEGAVRKTPFQLSRTCYKDQPLPCGVCGSCCERLTAFEENGITDPVHYENLTIYKTFNAKS